jgi:hypothetical protein
MLAAAPRHVPLHAGGRALLVVPGVAPVRVSVATTSAELATLVLEDAALPARLLHRSPAAILVGHRFRADGRLTMVADARGRVRDDVLAFRPAPQRRRDPRLPAVVPVTLVPAAPELPAGHGLTLDLSAGGLLVRGGPELGEGEPLALQLTLPADDPPVRAAGEVVRTTPDGLRGVRLDRVRPADRERLLRWAQVRR